MDKKIKARNIFVITYWSYKDALIQSYTLPYVKMIRKNIGPNNRVYMLTAELERFKVEADQKKVIKEQLLKEGIIWIDFTFRKFGLGAIFLRMWQMMRLLYITFTKNISHIHAFCTTAGVTGYYLSVLSGKTFILDSYEPHADPSIENGTWKKDSFAYRFLFNNEKKQTNRAQYLVSTSTFMKQYAKERYEIDIKNYFLKPALIDLNQFSFEQKKDSSFMNEYGLHGKIVGVYAGKIGGIYLEHETFDLLKQAFIKWGDQFRMIFLTEASEDEVNRRAALAGIPPGIIIRKFIPHHQVPIHLGLGDFAINPVKVVYSKKCCTSIKDGEYWALGLPVIITNSLVDDVNIIRKNGMGYVLKETNEAEYKNAINHIDHVLKTTTMEERFSSIRKLAQEYRTLDIAEKIYSEIYSK